MHPRGQPTVETLIVIASAVFLVLLVYTTLRSQAVGAGLSNVEAESGNVSSAVSNFSPSPRTGNVNPCASCTANTSCPAGLDLIQSCAQECVYDECVPCNAKCGFGCRTVSTPGYYALSDDLSSSGTCFTITANDVWLDCRGHSLTGTGTGSAVAIYGSGRGTNNFSLRNCRTTGFYYGVFLSYSNDGVIQNNSFSSPVYGVFAQSSNNLVFFNNTVDRPAASGVFLSSSRDANVSFNNVSSPVVSGASLSASSSNKILGNNFTNASYAVFLTASSASNTISGNTLYRSRAAGIGVLSSASNVFYYNNISNTSGNGVYLLSSSSNAFSYNTISQTTSYGILLSGGASNAFSYNTVGSSGASGFYLSGTVSAAVSLNTVTNPVSYGVQLAYSVSSSAFSSNTFTGGLCPFYNCQAGPCGTICSGTVGTCSSNSFSRNSPNKCTKTGPIGS